jgi:TonB family protein
MNDASERYARQIEIARHAVGQGDRRAAVEALKAAIGTTRGDPALHREHATALVRLGALEQELGRPADAERLFMEAIAVGERNLGADHPALAVALNELSRLHVRQSDYARAEPVLKRLLVIARAKGDVHPDVATALAGLAVAKRGLGQNAAAEVLYRHALRIREEVLAPDHMAIVVTLEQLSETCATRGNVAEALVHLQRALLKRERALGDDHASVRGLRTRIADLERRLVKPNPKAAERPVAALVPEPEIVPAAAAPATLVEPPAPEPAPPPRASGDWRATPARPRFFASTATQPQRTGELKFLYQPVPTASKPPRPSGERPLTPARSVAAATSWSGVRVLSPLPESVGLARTAALPAPVATLSPAPAPVADFVPAMADVPVIETSSRDVTDLFASIKRATRYASAGAGVIVLAIVGSWFGTSAESEGEQVPGASGAESSVVVATLASSAKSLPAIEGSSSAGKRSESGAAANPAATQPDRVSDESETTPRAPVAVPSLRKLVVPKVAMPSLDSLMRPDERLAGDADTGPSTTGAGPLPSAPSEDAIVRPPVLVYAPTLRFPDELRARPIDGEVIVQFRVNEKGRVDASSMQVLHSEHDLFTSAVRNALPRFRFEPARSVSSGSKPQVAWVQFRAEFTARN